MCRQTPLSCFFLGGGFSGWPLSEKKHCRVEMLPGQAVSNGWIFCFWGGREILLSKQKQETPPLWSNKKCSEDSNPQVEPEPMSHRLRMTLFLAVTSLHSRSSLGWICQISPETIVYETSPVTTLKDQLRSCTIQICYLPPFTRTKHLPWPVCNGIKIINKKHVKTTNVIWYEHHLDRVKIPPNFLLNSWLMS